MDVRVGVDLVEVERMHRLLADHPQGIEDLFTAREIDYCAGKRRRAMHFAGRFAAKEAVLKAFGTGLSGRIRWTEVEVVNGPFGRPSVRLHGAAAARAERHGLSALDLSLTHSPKLAMAGVVTTWTPTRGRPLPPGWATADGTRADDEGMEG